MVTGEERRTSRRDDAAKRGIVGRLFGFLLGALLFLVLIGIGFWIWYEIAIVMYPGEEISQDRIQRIFTLESPVYYDDGVTVLGVFFQEEHRSYVPYVGLPRYFVDALLAAEDKNFFSHPGFDITGILRALYLNLRAGRVVQGGSSITQQTAKNLFKRQKRSLGAKFVELVHALKLEAHYSKEQILEWYANQFYVSGNGRGVGIAAQYFFDKPVGELSMLECAFLAACVKAPNRYNPFIQKSEEDRERALRHARQRTDYVLNNMVKLGLSTQAQYEEALRQEIPFKQGQIRYPLNAILDELRKRLERPDIREALLKAGVDNIATSGIRIYTSIRKELQEAALKALRENLSVLETRLSGYERDKVLERYASMAAAEDQVERSEFLFGTVKSIQQQKGSPEIMVALSDRGVGVVNQEGLQPFLEAFAQSRRGPWAKPKKEDVEILLRDLRRGDPIFVRLRGGDEQGQAQLAMEQYPEVNGGVLVLQDGFIRAMVGGMDNIHFNRAIDARRQVGSVFKPLVYAAALQLGWNNLDPLRNRWQVFPYQGQLYIPHPDHQSPHDWVSMTWAGAKSENIATVWLLYHLCDRLNLSQLKELAALLDMAPRADEPRVSFIQRIRDQMGILVSRDALLRTAFEEAREEVRTDLIFEGKDDVVRALDDLHYGLGIERYLRENGWTPKRLSGYKLTGADRRELRALFHNFLRFRVVQEEMRNDYEVLRWALTQGDPAARIPLAMQGKRQFFWDPQLRGERCAYTTSPEDDSLVPIDLHWLSSRLEEGQHLEEILPLSEILVDGALPAGLLDQLQAAIQRRLDSLRSQDPYSLDVLCRVRDFRITMALRYAVMLAKRMGVLSPLDAVLSIPLGSNSVTLEDVSRMYYSLITGKVFPAEGDGRWPSTYLITRIEGQDGEVLYEAEPQPVRLLPPEQCHLVSEILRKVISNGTGRKANKALWLSGVRHEDLLRELKISVPALGKTGTSDAFRNSSFVGFLPGPSDGHGALTLDKGVVLAAYVGYDDNRSMKNNRIRIFGASGALPVWISTARAAIRYLDYEDKLDLVDLSFRPGAALPVEWPAEMIEVPVDSGSGFPRLDERKGPLIRTYGSLLDHKVDLRRVFSPLPKTEEGK